MIALLGELGIGWERSARSRACRAASLAAILAEAGDPRRYASSSSLVKHAGMSPARNESAAFRGRTVISRRGRPGLRLAAWRATWGVLRHCGVLAARHAAFTTRDQNKLADAQARTACAAALLRWIYALIIHGTTWNPQIAAGEAATTPPAASPQPPPRNPEPPSQAAVISGLSPSQESEPVNPSGTNPA